MSIPYRLEARGITKTFPGVKALSDVSLNLGAGEVLAVVGENGAGKSTLMKVLAGVQGPDVGVVQVDGQDLAPGSVSRALAAGVALIHQELNLAENLDVASNVMLGREVQRFGLVDNSATVEASLPALKAVGLDVDPQTPLSDLTIGRQQLVEIAKALSVKARVLIMDEPTSSLSGLEADRLFEVVRSLRDSGVSIIYISHRLSEVIDLADRVLVLRDGLNAGELCGAEITHSAMVRLMVGRDVSAFYQHEPCTPGDLALEVRGLRTCAYPGQGVDLNVRAGEIVGVAGLVGAGRTEVLEALFGVSPPLAGEVTIGGKAARITCPRDAVHAGLALVPEDRKQQGLVLDFTVEQNVSLGSLLRMSSLGFIDRAGEGRLAANMISSLSIKTPGPRQVTRYLSGGNQQKVVIGRWLATEPVVLLLDEPTRGVDIGAKEEIYRLLEELTGRGVGVLFVSSEMEEVLGLADRVLVMHEGEVAGELGREQLTEQAVMALATNAVGVGA